MVYIIIVGGMAVLFLRLPTSFLPEEDEWCDDGRCDPDAYAAGPRSGPELLSENEKANVESVFTVNGFSFSGQARIAFISLKPWEARPGAENSVEAIVGRATKAFSQIKDGLVFPFNLPAIIELGTATGFDFELIDQANGAYLADAGAE